MKYALSFTFAFLLSFLTIGQNSFEPGYYIDNDGKRIDCLVENIEWLDNPSKFRIKASENSDVQTKSIDEVAEFGYGQFTKYRRFEVDIDRTPDNVRKLSDKREAVFNREVLFLKVLVEGKASLYYYEGEAIRRYFYQLDASKVQQLVYKKYRIRANEIGYNSQYRSQLLEDLNCDVSVKSIEKVEYKTASLVDFFSNFNECKKAANKDYTLGPKKKGIFHLALKPGIVWSSPSATATAGGRRFSVDNHQSYRMGLALEYHLPFYGYKWALLFEPAYYSFSLETGVEGLFGVFDSAYVDFNAIEIPIGGRRYFNLSDNFQLYVNGYVTTVIPVDSQIVYGIGVRLDDTINWLGLTGGAGFTFRSKYSVEFRFTSNDYLWRDSIGIYDGFVRHSMLLFSYTIK